MIRNWWRLWSYSLGRKEGKTDKEADAIAIIRTVIFLTYMVTNFAIIANAVRHWNDNEHLCDRSKSMEVRSSSSG